MAKARRALVAGNWKMNGLARPALREIRDFARRLSRAKRPPAAEIAVFPPATLLAPLAAELRQRRLARRIGLGGQDCHVNASGAHTGDISADMLKDAGCRYVIVGHSERRADHGETDALIARKAAAAHAAGLIVIVCIGETGRERNRGRTLAVLSRQLARSLPDGAGAKNTVIAYEPVWAIGTGRTPTIDDIAKAHAHIRRRLQRRFADGVDFRVLYGGSVKPANAGPILAVADVDGALVGGASLKAADFWAIVTAAP